MKDNLPSAHCCRISPREKEVACNLFAMHILHFCFVGQLIGDGVLMWLTIAAAGGEFKNENIVSL